MYLNRHRGNDNDLGEVSAGNRARRPRYWRRVEWLMSSEWPRVIAVVIVFIIIGQLAGCTSGPKEPCKTWVCQQAEMRSAVARQCRRALAEELREEIQAGFYSHGGIGQACRQYARQVIR